MAKKKLLRLANGAIETEERVGPILIALRGLASQHPAEFEALAKWSIGMAKTLTQAAEDEARRAKLLKEGKKELYDDVKDVFESILIRRGNHVAMGGSPLHKDQTNINHDDYEE